MSGEVVLPLPFFFWKCLWRADIHSSLDIWWNSPMAWSSPRIFLISGFLSSVYVTGLLVFLFLLWVRFYSLCISKFCVSSKVILFVEIRIVHSLIVISSLWGWQCVSYFFPDLSNLSVLSFHLVSLDGVGKVCFLFKEPTLYLILLMFLSWFFIPHFIHFHR